MRAAAQPGSFDICFFSISFNGALIRRRRKCYGDGESSASRAVSQSVAGRETFKERKRTCTVRTVSESRTKMMMSEFGHSDGSRIAERRIGKTWMDHSVFGASLMALGWTV